MTDTVIRPDEPRRPGDTAARYGAVTPVEDARSVILNRVSWAAVLAGVVIALVAQLILNMIGVGIGAATLQPGAGADRNPSAAGFSIGAAAWWTVSGILAALAGGFTAGRLSGQPRTNWAAWHGFTSWALTTLVIAWLFTSTVGTILGGAYRGLGDAAAGLGQSASGALRAAAPALGSDDPFRQIEQSLRGALGNNDPTALRDGAVAAVRLLVTSDGAQAEDARSRAAQALARAQDIPIEDARARVRDYEQQYHGAVQQARREATEAAATASKALSRGALTAAVALLLGAVAGWFGGRLGAVDPALPLTPTLAPQARR